MHPPGQAPPSLGPHYPQDCAGPGPFPGKLRSGPPALQMLCWHAFACVPGDLPPFEWPGPCITSRPPAPLAFPSRRFCRHRWTCMPAATPPFHSAGPAVRTKALGPTSLAHGMRLLFVPSAAAFHLMHSLLPRSSPTTQQACSSAGPFQSAHRHTSCVHGPQAGPSAAAPTSSSCPALAT